MLYLYKISHPMSNVKTSWIFLKKLWQHRNGPYGVLLGHQGIPRRIMFVKQGKDRRSVKYNSSQGYFSYLYIFQFVLVSLYKWSFTYQSLEGQFQWHLSALTPQWAVRGWIRHLCEEYLHGKESSDEGKWPIPGRSLQKEGHLLSYHRLWPPPLFFIYRKKCCWCV